MSEQQAQELMYQMQTLEGYFSQLAQKESSIISIIKEAAAAIESLKTIDDKTDVESLIPVGLGAFVKAKVATDEKLILNVGAGIAVEKDRNSAINFLESRLKEMEVALQETAGQKQQVAMSLEQGKQQMEQLMAASKKK